MQRVAAVIIIAVEYDTVQEVSRASIIDRIWKNLNARGYHVNDVNVTAWTTKKVDIEVPGQKMRPDS